MKHTSKKESMAAEWSRIEPILEALQYNHITGELTWKVSRGNKIKTTKLDPTKRFTLSGKQYSPEKVAWCIWYGYYPKHHVYRHSNDNGTNNSIMNLYAKNIPSEHKKRVLHRITR